MLTGKSMQTKYRQKPDVGSGDEVTETLLEITPLVRQGFDAVVNIPDLQQAVDNNNYEERQAGKLSSRRRGCLNHTSLD